MSNGDASPAGTSATEGAAVTKSDPAAPGPFGGGVTLLLRGNDRTGGAASALSAMANATSSDSAESPGSPFRTRTAGTATAAQPAQPGWIPTALFGSDLVMVAVAAFWAFAGVGDWRWIGIGALLAVGCVQALVAWTLVRPQGSGTPAHRGGVETSAAPRIRVHFVDETPRHRR